MPARQLRHHLDGCSPHCNCPTTASSHRALPWPTAPQNRPTQATAGAPDPAVTTQTARGPAGWAGGTRRPSRERQQHAQGQQSGPAAGPDLPRPRICMQNRSILSDPAMTKSNAQPPQVSRGHYTKLQGWPGGLLRRPGAHQGGRGGPRGCQILLGSIIRSGEIVTYDAFAPVCLRCIP